MKTNYKHINDVRLAGADFVKDFHGYNWCAMAQRGM
jgi:hypothetical protein